MSGHEDTCFVCKKALDSAKKKKKQNKKNKTKNVEDSSSFCCIRCPRSYHAECLCMSFNSIYVLFLYIDYSRF